MEPPFLSCGALVSSGTWRIRGQYILLISVDGSADVVHRQCDHRLLAGFLLWVFVFGQCSKDLVQE